MPTILRPLTEGEDYEDGHRGLRESSRSCRSWRGSGRRPPQPRSRWGKGEYAEPSRPAARLLRAEVIDGLGIGAQTRASYRNNWRLPLTEHPPLACFVPWPCWRQPDRSVLEVSIAVGFDDGRAFPRSFTRDCGQTPVRLQATNQLSTVDRRRLPHLRQLPTMHAAHRRWARRPQGHPHRRYPSVGSLGLRLLTVIYHCDITLIDDRSGDRHPAYRRRPR